MDGWIGEGGIRGVFLISGHGGARSELLWFRYLAPLTG